METGWDEMDELWVQLLDERVEVAETGRDRLLKMLVRLGQQDRLLDAYGEVLDVVIEVLRLGGDAPPAAWKVAKVRLGEALALARAECAAVAAEVERERRSQAMEDGMRQHWRDWLGGEPDAA